MGDLRRARRESADAALARQTYWVLAELAAQHVDSPVTLASSAPVVASRGDGELTVAVSFEPGSCQFVATRVEGRFRHTVYFGPSLVLACSSANQALLMLAPLESLVCARDGDAYRRTRPQYRQEVRFCDALTHLGQLAGAFQAARGPGSGAVQR